MWLCVLRQLFFIMSSSSRIFLSVCILTKNEAQFIGDCINSVKRVADEILVLDSDSTDDTVAIATAAGCRVMQQPWVDFSFARNTLIAQARGKWILFLDADETLHNAALLKLRLRYLTGKKTGGFLMERTEIFRHKDSGKIESVPIGLVRLFRNHAQVRFEYTVHETVDASVLKAGFEIGMLKRARLHHRIFLSERAYIDTKQKKYLEMIEAYLAGDGNDGWMLLHKAKTQWYFERTREALATYKHLIGLESISPNIKATACCHAASLCVHHGNPDEALRFLERSLALVKDQSLAWLVKGDLHFAAGHYSEALACYHQLRPALPSTYHACIFSYLYTPAPVKLFKMGCCHLALGNIGKAYLLFKAGLRMQKGAAENWLGLAHCYHERKDYPQALHAVMECLELNPAWNQALTLKKRIVSRASTGSKSIAV